MIRLLKIFTLALGMEVDRDGSYWQHYTTRHNPQRYAELYATIKDTFIREFNAGRLTGNLIAVYDRPHQRGVVRSR